MKASVGTLSLLFTCISTGAQAQTIDLGSAASFGALAPETITSTGLTVINGDLGLSPGTSITGFPPGIFTGSEHLNDDISTAAQADARTAFTQGQGLGFTVDQAGTATIGGSAPYVPGVYKYDGAVTIADAVYLDAAGNSSAIFVFQLASTLTVNSPANVVLLNGASSCNIFWVVGSSATFGAYTSFIGNILAYAAVSVQTAATIQGGIYAGSAVTLDTNTISPACAASNTTSSSRSLTSSTTLVSASSSTSLAVVTTSVSTSVLASSSVTTSATSPVVTSKSLTSAVTSKSTLKSTTTTSPKTTSKTTSKTTVKTTPSTTAKTTSKTTAKTTSSITAKTTLKTTSSTKSSTTKSSPTTTSAKAGATPVGCEKYLLNPIKLLECILGLLH